MSADLAFYPELGRRELQAEHLWENKPQRASHSPKQFQSWRRRTTHELRPAEDV